MKILNYIIITLVILTKQVNTRNYFKNSDTIIDLFEKIKIIEDDYLEENDKDFQENEDDGSRYEFKGQI